MDSWDDTGVQENDKWVTEDADVKDNWDDSDSDDEKPVVSKEPAKKLTTKQRIMAKEEKKKAELEAKREEMKKTMAEMTPEEKANEKLRMRKIQEEADLRIAVDMMGLNDKDASEELVAFKDAKLGNKAGLEAFGAAFLGRVKQEDDLQKTLYYATFLETFFKDLCAEVSHDDMKKVIAALNALYNDKVKAAKPVKGKKKPKKDTINFNKKASDLGSVDDRFADDLDDFI